MINKQVWKQLNLFIMYDIQYMTIFLSVAYLKIGCESNHDKYKRINPIRTIGVTKKKNDNSFNCINE